MIDVIVIVVVVVVLIESNIHCLDFVCFFFVENLRIRDLFTREKKYENSNENKTKKKPHKFNANHVNKNPVIH